MPGALTCFSLRAIANGGQFIKPTLFFFGTTHRFDLGMAADFLSLRVMSFDLRQCRSVRLLLRGESLFGFLNPFQLLCLGVTQFLDLRFQLLLSLVVLL